MGKAITLQVQEKEITINRVGEEDYISLTDMAGGKNPDTIIGNWLRNKNTIEFLGVWEKMNNPNFKPLEFEGFKNEAGLNRFILSPKQWAEKTGAIGLYSKAGRYGGGTFAHVDIAFEFGTWISPEFKLLLITEFKRLKAEEARGLGRSWDMRREIARTNYVIHTDAVKDGIVPLRNLPKDREWLVYAEEADLLNMALFNMTAAQWRAKHPEEHKQGLNIRDLADLHQVLVLANLESLNATLIQMGTTDKGKRFMALRNAAVTHLDSLSRSNLPETMNVVSPYVKSSRPQLQVFDKDGKATRSVPKAELDGKLQHLLTLPPDKKKQ